LRSHFSWFDLCQDRMLTVAAIEVFCDPLHHAVAFPSEKLRVPMTRSFAHCILRRPQYAATRNMSPGGSQLAIAIGIAIAVEKKKKKSVTMLMWRP
jgi:hypothetical protein